MLSILIPEYNYDCTKLVHDLAEQCNKANIAYEIIVLDDASTLCNIENRKISDISGCQFLESDVNIGSAKIRNNLAKMAKYPHLLMIDCDAEVRNEKYIQRYLEVIDQCPVIIGGVCYSQAVPPPDRYLRWFYGKNRECPPAIKRNKDPYKSLLSFNLMMDKDMIANHPYNEHFEDYGHEDSVMGFTLKQAGIRVLHIDNPLIHKGLDLNEIFLAKSLKAVEKYMTNPAFQTEELTDQIKIFRVFRKLKSAGLHKLLAFKFRIAGKLMERNLCGRHPSLFLYDFYRLSYLCEFYRTTHK